jgi:predicted dienelactone hydrolase
MSGMVRPEVCESQKSRVELEARNLPPAGGFAGGSLKGIRPRLMSGLVHARQVFSLPKDYIHRRRLVRRITNVLLIVGLSAAAGYVISRPTGGTGFRPPKRSALSGTLPAPAVDPNASTTERAAESQGGYKLARGPFATGELADLVVHDGKRERDIHVRVFYPRSPGPFPVIVFSHGAGGSKNCCEALTEHWASYGYVVLQPTHEDSITEQRSQEERLALPARETLERPELWESRLRDISAVLDALPEMERRIAEITGLLNLERIGVAGHSMGSFAAEAVGGALVRLPGNPAKSFADGRVKAVLCLSPQGPGQFGLSQNSFEKLALPYMGITGSLDSQGAATPAWHKVPFDKSAPGDKYHLLIKGATHMSFISDSARDRTQAGQTRAIFGYTSSATLAFWDAYLKSERGAKEYLGSEALPENSQDSVEIFRR